MIYQNTQNENTQNQFSNAIRELQLGKLLRKANITKSCGIPAYEVFQFLLLLVFQGKNLFWFLNSKHKDQAVSKNTYYRFLNDTSYNWKKFLLFLAVSVTAAFDKLTRPERVKVLILDDSIIKRNRSKAVELLARVYDHVDHDFPIPELGKVSPYGVYVLNNNTGFVNLGTSHDTSEFAVTSISCWWNAVGKNTFPAAKRIYITCDGGGSNGSRSRNWKYELQQPANDTGLEIMVSHYPISTSKWNKIEHRMFCYISKNWQGQPLIDIETVISLISNTTTEKRIVYYLPA